jgi:hypothetical protein
VAATVHGARLPKSIEDEAFARLKTLAAKLLESIKTRASARLEELAAKL